jgi:HK97 family phage major capsid protein
MQTIDDLVVERARGLDAIDDILRTAAERPEAERALTADERADHDYLVAACDDLETQISRAHEANDNDLIRANHEVRRGWTPPTVNVNRIGVAPATATRSLDELLHASAETVVTASGARNPVEDTIVRSRDGAEVAAPRINHLLPEHQGAVRAFQSTVADMVIAGAMLGRGATSSAEGFTLARSLPQFSERYNHVLRALDVDTSGEGADWVPTGIGSTLHERVRAEGKIAPLFQSIQLPTNPWKMPIEGTDSVAYRMGEPTTDTESKPAASTPGTVAATFDAEIFAARSLWSRTTDADSVVAMLPYVQRKLVGAFVTAEERAILDGDSDGTHQDTDVHALGATDARWAWDGLRKKAIAQTIVTATTATAANLGLLRAGMGKWGLNPTDLVFIVGVSNMHDILADSNVLTVDKFGPNATILNGQIAAIHGVPIVVSEHVRENLNATGVHDAITTTKTYMLCVNRNEWVMGQRMALDIEADDSIYRETFQRVLVGFRRQDFQHVGSAATNEDTAIAYNVTP